MIQRNGTNTNLTLKLKRIVFYMFPCLILPPQSLQSGKFCRKTIKIEVEDKNLEGLNL